MDLFLRACGATGPPRLGVEPPAVAAAVRRESGPPFLLAGREARADLPLDDPAVSKRHAYLQVIAGRVFCLDLQSRGGVRWDGRPRHSGWLEPGQAVGIGPFTVRLLGDGLATPAAPAADYDPLASLPPDQDPLPRVGLEVLSGSQRNTTWRMDRVLALVGQAPVCQVRAASRGVSRCHCGLLRTPLGLWVIDLMATEGTSVNGTPVRWARLGDGDELRLGDLLLGVRCHPASGPAAAPVPVSGAQAAGAPASSVLRSGEALRAERDRPRGEERAAAAEAERLRAQVAALEGALAEAAATRDGLVKAGQEARAQWEAERQALRGQWEQEQRGRAEERAGADAERRQWREQLEAARRQLDQERGALQGEVDRLRQQADALRRERDQLAAQCDQAAARHAEVAEQVGALRAELGRRKEQEAALRNDLEAARAEASAGAERGREQLEAARGQFEHERRAVGGEVERLRQEADALRQEREALLRQVEALGRERDDLAAPGAALAPSHREAEQRFQAAADRFIQLVAQIQSLCAELRQSCRRPGGLRGALRWLRGRSSAEREEWDLALYRRLESLRTEADAAQERAAQAALEAARADLERQLAEARRQLEWAAERADCLEAELQGYRGRGSRRSPPAVSPAEPEATPT
jgi:pSer/pThr/pTyr-binding forkhead associated (FHA) protein